jgi:hypothetical protein
MCRHVKRCTDLVVGASFHGPHDHHHSIAPLQASKRAFQVGPDLQTDSFL